MSLFLDSAQIEEAREAQEMGYIEGISTNPRQIAQAERPAFDVLADLVDAFEGHVFYQVTAPNLEARIDEAWQAHDIRSDRVVVKLPATSENLSMVSKLPGVDVAFTAVYSPAQAYLAMQTEAHFVIPYVNRATHQLGDGIQLIRDIAQILRGSETQILAVSLKTIEEALNALNAGAHHIALPMNLIKAMGEHDLSNQAIEEFLTS